MLCLWSPVPLWLPLVKQYNEGEMGRRPDEDAIDFMGLSQVLFLFSARIWFYLGLGVRFGYHCKQVVQMKSQWFLSS